MCEATLLNHILNTKYEFTKTDKRDRDVALQLKTNSAINYNNDKDE